MNIRGISEQDIARVTGACSHDRNQINRTLFWQRAMSRRQFVRSAVGVASVGAAMGSGVWRSGLAVADSGGAPVPIHGGTPVLGGAFHVFGPTANGSFDPIDAEPSTITDFNGSVGLAYISGMVTRTNTKTGEVRTLPFVDTDMRFMKGVFRGTDGKNHKGAFAFL